MEKIVVVPCAMLIAALLGGCGKRSSPSEVVVRAKGESVAQPPSSSLPLQDPVLFAAGETVDLLTAGTDAGGASTNQLLSYDPAANVWKVLTAPPFDPPLFLPAVVWTGTAVVVVGTPCGKTEGKSNATDDFECSPGGAAAAVYDPSADTWTPASQPPGGAPKTGGGPFHRSVGWDGSRALFIVGDSLVAYDPTRNTWSTRTSATELRTARDWCIAGDRVVAMNSTRVRRDVTVITQPGDKPRPLEYYSSGDTFIDPTVYETRADGDIVALPALPDSEKKTSYDYTLTCTPTQLVVFTAKLDKIWTYDLAREAWEVTPGANTAPAPWNHRYWTGTNLVLWDELSTQAWSLGQDGRLVKRTNPPRVPSDTTVWTGTEFAAFLREPERDRFVLFPG
jgi:hypothetical protein